MTNYVALDDTQASPLTDAQGNVLAGHRVFIYQPGTWPSSPAQVQLYSDQGVTPLAQPIVTNNLGELPGYAASPQIVDLYDATSGVLQAGVQIISALDVAGGSRTSIPVPYAASITPVLPAGDAVYDIGVLTGNTTINAPSGTPADGQMIQFRFIQDATGGRTISWGGGYAFGTDVTTSLIPTAAHAKWTMLFGFDSTSGLWRALAISRGF